MLPPLRFTRSWVAENPELFRELSKPPDECCVCYEPFGPECPALGPLLDDWPTRCRHHACEDCWRALTAQPPPWHCPVCREDVSSWLADTVCWEPPEDSVDALDVRLFTEVCLELLEQLCMAPRLQDLGRRVLRHLPARPVG